MNGEKYRPQDISPINFFSFVTLRNEILIFLETPYPTLMQPLKSFHHKVFEFLLATQTLIYNQSVYILNPLYNITSEHNSFKNYSHKWTLYNDNQ